MSPADNATARAQKGRNATSLHPGVVNFTFCDGSVRTINENIESHKGYTNSCPGIVNTADFLYQNLYRIDDGASVSLP